MTTKAFSAEPLGSGRTTVVQLTVRAYSVTDPFTVPMPTADARALAAQLLAAADEAEEANRRLRRIAPAGQPSFEEVYA